MTRDQNILVEENLGLIGHVIKRVFKGSPRLGCMDYDDLFQIGSIGLCKAVESYKDDGRATFGTYACVVIRNEFYKAIEKDSHPESVELTETIPALAIHDEPSSLAKTLLDTKGLSSADKRNIRALLLFAKGYSCKQIGESLGVSDRQASALISRARAKLRKIGFAEKLSA